MIWMQYADGVALMVEMGFSVEQSHASLLKTHGDIERAAHYLLTGMYYRWLYFLRFKMDDDSCI